MCLIISSQTGSVPDVDVLRHAFSYNPHGWGVAYHDGRVVRVEKGMKRSAMLSAMERIDGNPYVLHFRYATHGKRNRANTHPFRLSNGVWMAHNGIIRIDTPDKDRSDTAHFADLLSGILSESPAWFGTADFTQEVETFIGRSNKLAFISPDGEITHAHAGQGVWIDGLWYSNDYSIPRWHALGTSRDASPVSTLWDDYTSDSEDDMTAWMASRTDSDADLLADLRRDLARYYPGR